MEHRQVENFKIWFRDYVAGFYSDDEFVNDHIKLKEDHSIRTCQEMNYLTEHLRLSDNQKNIAEVIALFHDLGRFRQFMEYRTYNDQQSTNHCRLALEVLEQTKILDSLNDNEKEWINRAIEYHGLKQLPEGLNGDCLSFSKLIRDADKLDVYYVVTDYYAQYNENPEGFKLEMEFPDEPGYSSELVWDVLEGRRADYSKLTNWNDMKILQLGWVYDVNFTSTLRRIKERRFLEMILDFLPKNEDMKKISEKIFKYVDSRIEKKE
ncbi:MAG: HD domain-containing protein [Planctomycetota bacterium]|jgi:hypothetical protein